MAAVGAKGRTSMSSTSSSSSLSPGDRAVVRASPGVAGVGGVGGVEPGTIVWVKRVAADGVEVDTEEAVPRALTLPLAALAAFPTAVEPAAAKVSRDRQDRRRPSLLVQVLRPIAFFIAAYCVYRSLNRWPRFEEPRALPSPPVQQPALPRDG
jgi:hypothetical protein